MYSKNATQVPTVPLVSCLEYQAQLLIEGQPCVPAKHLGRLAEKLPLLAHSGPAFWKVLRYKEGGVIAAIASPIMLE